MGFCKYILFLTMLYFDVYTILPCSMSHSAAAPPVGRRWRHFYFRVPVLNLAF